MSLDKAVILAAGRGSRMGKHLPKPWLPVDGLDGGPSFLDWHLTSLFALGVKEVILVGSPETMGLGLPARADDRVRWLLNPHQDVGSAHSAHVAWSDGILDGKSRVLLMDADLIYDPAIMAHLVAAPGRRSKLLIHAEHRHSGEEVLVYGPPDAPLIQGKGLPGTPMVEGLPCLGEATGMLLWEPGDHEVLKAASTWTLGFSTAKLRSEHEDVTNALMRTRRLEAVICPSGARFLEVDTPEDYALMTQEVYPALAGS